jgi:hypothetical protein
MFQLIVTWILPCSKWVIIKFINGFGKKQRSEHLKFTEINNASMRQKITVAGGLYFPIKGIRTNIFLL